MAKRAVRGRERQPEGRSGGVRRWIRFGPGVVLAVVASFIVWRSDPMRARQGPLSSPVRAGQKAMPVPAPPAAPDLSFVLEKRQSLELTDGQVRALTAIRRRWDREMTPARQAADQAAGEFRDGMEAQGAKGETMRGYQQRGSAVTDYSRQLFAARRAAWTEASLQLSARQREEAELLWHRRLGGR